MKPSRTRQPSMEDVLSSLRNSSFAALDESEATQRVVMNLMGKDKEGKTHMGLAFSSLGPLALFDFDFGTEGVSKKFQKSGSPIVHAKYLLQDDSEEDAMSRWKRFRRDWYAALKSSKIRTMMLDQGASMYQAIRLALFGKLSKVPPHKYDAVNAELNKIITSIYPTDKNLILLHPLKAEYKRDGDDDMGRKTGKLVMDGWPRIHYLVQVNAVAYRSHSKDQKQADPEGYKDEPPAGGFGLKIINCRHNPKAAGVKLFGAPQRNSSRSSSRKKMPASSREEEKMAAKKTVDPAEVKMLVAENKALLKQVARLEKALGKIDKALDQASPDRH